MVEVVSVDKLVYIFLSSWMEYFEFGIARDRRSSWCHLGGIAATTTNKWSNHPTFLVVGASFATM